MMGIRALRDRPGLALDASLVHGSGSQLEGLAGVMARGAAAEARMAKAGMHHIDVHAALKPAAVGMGHGGGPTLM
jgi:hypothetical protein